MKNKFDVTLPEDDKISLTVKFPTVNVGWMATVDAIKEGDGMHELTEHQQLVWVMQAELIQSHMNSAFDRHAAAQFIRRFCEYAFGNKNYYQIHYANPKKGIMELVRHHYTAKHNIFKECVDFYDCGVKIWTYRNDRLMCTSDLPFHAMKWMKANGVARGAIEAGFEDTIKFID